MQINEACEGILHLKSTIEHTFFKEFFAQYESEDGLNHSHIITLLSLNHWGPAPMSTISEKVNLEKGSFTTVSKKLIEQGYMVKERDQEDKRVYNLHLTDKGHQYVETFRKTHLTFIEGKISQLDEAEQKTYMSAVESLIEMTQRISCCHK